MNVDGRPEKARRNPELRLFDNCEHSRLEIGALAMVGNLEIAVLSNFTTAYS